MTDTDTNAPVHDPAPAPALTPSVPRRSLAVAAALIAATAAALSAGGALMRRASAQTNSVALASSPKGVTVIEARAALFRPTRRYVGTVEPWAAARVGPQLVAAYVHDVLVRPGAVVRRGEVLATLDCRNASTASRAVALQARAIEARQAALARQSDRLAGLAQGGFAATNEAEQRAAETASEAARLAAARAQLAGSALAVDDCVLRAPFAGEVSARMMDPGGFARPGSPVVALVDRAVLRVVTDVPETDFDAVAPGTVVRMRLLATGRELVGSVARRSPGADPATRTIHAEIDVPDPERSVPVDTTAELTIEVGRSVPSIEIPATAASLRGDRAGLYTVEGSVARRRRVTLLGERGGSLFVSTDLAAGAHVVTEGRGLLEDGDRVAERVEPFGLSPPPPAPAPAPPAGPSAPPSVARALQGGAQ